MRFSEIKESESSTTIAPATNMLTSSIEESVYVAGSGHQDTDTRVEFYSNKLITDAELSVILLYIENKKASGGGDTISYELDNTRRLLTVKYERASAKKRVIEKQMHKFGEFTLNANEPFDKSKLSDPNRLVIILHGISESVEKSFVQLYTENLVVNDDEENDVEKIERSKLLRDVVYVTFKTPIDEARIRSRVQKRPKLNNCSLKFFPAYKTNIVVVKLPQSCSNVDTNGRDLVELYFSNKKRCGADPYSLVLMRDPFMYLVYNNENDCLNIVSREHKIGKYHLDVEYLHNFDLFESTEIGHLDNQEAATSTSDSSIKQEAKQEPKNELVEEKIQKQEEPQVENEIKNLEAKIPLNMAIEEASTGRAPPPKLHISIQQEPKLKIFKEMPNIWNRFELELSERQSRCEQSSEDGSIRVVCTHELPRSPVEYMTVKTKWETDILKYLSEFFLQLDICQMEIKSRDVFVELNRSIGMDSQECRMNLIDEHQLELIGLKQSVAEVRAQIEQKIAEPVEDILDGLTLSQARMLLVKRYTRDMKIKFHDLECSVKAKELCVRYRGQPREIEEAKQKFELRLLINEEIQTPRTKKSPPLKSPLLDIKLRSNLIQLRTCVDSAFTLIELINYIVCDGDLHTINPNAATSTTQATSSTSNTAAAAVSSTLTAPSSIPAAVVAVGNQPPSSLIESKLNVIDELSAAIGSAASHAESISPSQHDMTTFSVGTPPQSSSFKSSSIGSYSSAVASHPMYSSPTARVPSSSQASNLSQVGETTSASSSLVPNQTKSQPIPLPTPSLSYNLKAIASASSATNNASFNLSSSAESIISDMMKEAMSSNPMLQSVYGSLESSSGAQQQQASSNNDYSPSAALKNKLLGGRKRNTSLTQQSSPDLQSKRMLSHNLLLLDLDNANKDDDKTILLKEKSLNSSEMTTASTLIKESISEEKLGLMTNKPSTLYVDDEKENQESNWLTQHDTSAAADEQDDDENLINLIDSNINMEMRSKKLLTDSQSSEGGELGLSIPTKTTTTTKTTKLSMKPSSNRTVMNVLDDDEGFTFDMPFAGVEMGALSPLSAKPSAASLKPSSSSTGLSYSSLLAAELKSIPSTGSMQQQQQQNSAQRQLKFGASNSTGASNSSATPGGSGRRRLYFKPKSGANRSDSESDADRRHHAHSSSDDDDSEDDDVELLKDFDIIDVIPGLGEPPRNNQDYEIKYLKSEKKSQEAATTAGASKPASAMTYSKYASALPSVSHRVEIRDDHFRKPLTKIDVLKAPDNYPVPLNVYCVQEISINWFLYGGHDFEASDVDSSANSGEDKSIKMMMNRTASSPVVMSSGMLHMTSTQTSPPPTMTTNQQQRSLTNSPSLSISPHHPPSPGALSSNVGYYYSPPRSSSTVSANPHVSYSPSSSSSSVVKYSTKSASLQFNKQSQQPMRKAGGRIISSLNWMHRGGRGRNLAACMEIGLHKLKTKVDLYADLSAAAAEEENNENKEEAANTCPYLYRVALAIGDIEIRDKLATSAFNMFLFRYESEQCPKHANSNMIFFKLLCSKSMDSQRLLECDIKLSVQPLRFNIDHDALIFLVEFFSKLASKDLNDFSKNLVPPIQQFTNDVNIESTSSFAAQPQSQPQPQIQQPQQQQPQAPPQQIFIRNFIFSPDLLIKFDFSGKYDARPDTKMDTFTRLLMMVVQLSNTEIKLKSLCSRRGFLGVEKLLEAIKREWQADIQRNQMKNLLKGWSVFNSLIQFVEGFTYLIWYPIEQYRRDGRVLCGIQKGSAAFSTCTVLATIELTNRMFLATKNIAEFFYDLVTPHRALQLQAPQSSSQQIQLYSSNQALMEQLFPGYAGSSPNSLQRRMRLRRQPNDIRDGLTNAYYVMYEGINDTVSNFLQEVAEGAEHKGIPGAIGGALRQLPSAALAPIVLTSEATCNFLTGLRNHINPDEKRDDDYKWKTTRDFY